MDNWQSARTGRFQFAVGQSWRIRERKINSGAAPRHVAAAAVATAAGIRVKRTRRNRLNGQTDGRRRGDVRNYVRNKFTSASPKIARLRRSHRQLPAVLLVVTDVEPARHGVARLSSTRLVYISQQRETC